MTVQRFSSRRFLRATMVLVMAGVALPGLAPLQAAPRAVPPEIQELREDISLLNLLRGLFLSHDQVRQLTALAEKASTDRHALLDQVEKDKGAITGALRRLRDSLFLPPGAEKEAQDKAATLDHRFKEARGELDDRIAALEDQAEKVLTKAQICIIEDFKPCLIPPKDLRNPVRVGQAGAEAGILGKIADLIHATPPQVWKAKGRALLDKVAGKMEEEAGKMTTAMRSDLVDRLQKSADAIRACTPVDYALKRESLAQDLLAINPKKVSKQGHRATGALGRWLLSDTALALYPQWEKNMDRLTPPTEGAVDEDPLPAGLEEMGKRVVNQLRRLHKNRRNASLPAFPAFIAPLERSLQAGDREAVFREVLRCLDVLLEINPGEDLAKTLAAVARFVARSTDLPLLHPKNDPYGFAAELREALDNFDPVLSCRQLRKLVDTLVQFRGPATASR